MSRTSRASIVSCLVIASVSAPGWAQPRPPVAAQTRAALPPSPFESEYARGDAARAEHRDADALSLFEALYTRSQEPRALAQVALAEAALGRWLDAEAHLIEALTALRDAWITRNRMSLLATLETMRAHVGTLVVTSDDDRAEVWIEGRRVGAVSAPLHVLAGEVAFEVRAEGRTPVSRSVTVPPNAMARAEVRFTADETPATTGPRAVEVAQPAADASAAATRDEMTQSRSDDAAPPVDQGSTQRSLGWVGVGTGIALVAGGVAAWFLGRGAADAYNNDPSCPGVGAPSQSDACASAQSTAATLEPLAWTAVGVGSALAVTGAILVGTAAGERRATSSTAGRCAPVVGVWQGLACGVAF
jgi:hypothetical protein